MSCGEASSLTHPFVFLGSFFREPRRQAAVRFERARSTEGQYFQNVGLAVAPTDGSDSRVLLRRKLVRNTLTAEGLHVPI
jgi:hypothetical protein